MLNTCQALADSPPLAPAITEFGFVSLVENQGSQSEIRSTTPGAHAEVLAGRQARDVSR